jgi:class 3 adenylate cyclase
MARLSPAERAKLTDNAFAYVDSHGNRRLPIHDEAHVRAALARFNQVRYEDDAARDRARQRVLRAAKRYRIVPVGFIAIELEVARRAASGRPALPDGFVTMLMTDIEGSTRLVQQLGERFRDLIDEVWTEIRAAIEPACGVEVEARADEFFAAFEAPRSAVDAAVVIQRRFAEHRFLGDIDVRIRVGIHSGYPTLTADNYVGVDVNITSRVTALGHGGQIVATASTREAVRATAGPAVRFVGLDAHRLRGLKQPLELFQVAVPGLPSRFPPLRT